MAENEERQEIYIRMCNDMEKDYAFSVSKKSKFGELIKIFEVLPMALRPSIFYHPIPTGFKVSTHPGHLTYNGSILFSYDAEEVTKDVKNDDIIEDQMWPTQLALPQWKFNSQRHLVFLLFLAGWLYTDLPDYISPTPGICLTNQMSRIAMKAALKYGYKEVAAKLFEEIQVNSATQIGQNIFFIVHIIKIALVYIMFRTGVINPISMNPFKMYASRTGDNKIDPRNEVLKEKLISIGWIGAKRATPDIFRDSFYQFKVDEVGGLVNAHRAGLIKKVAKPGFELEAGEGFATPVSDRNKTQTFATIKKEGRVVLGEDYFIEIEKSLKMLMDKAGEAGAHEQVRRFRRFGLYDATEPLKELYDLRKKAILEPVSQEEKKDQ